EGSKLYRVSPWLPQFDINDSTKIVNGLIKSTSHNFQHPKVDLKSRALMMYEMHIGMGCGDTAQEIGSFNRICKETITESVTLLQHVKQLGFNAIVIEGLQEHSCYSPGGWHVSFPF